MSNHWGKSRVFGVPELGISITVEPLLVPGKFESESSIEEPRIKGFRISDGKGPADVYTALFKVVHERYANRPYSEYLADGDPAKAEGLLVGEGRDFSSSSIRLRLVPRVNAERLIVSLMATGSTFGRESTAATKAIKDHFVGRPYSEWLALPKSVRLNQFLWSTRSSVRRFRPAYVPPKGYAVHSSFGVPDLMVRVDSEEIESVTRDILSLIDRVTKDDVTVSVPPQETVDFASAERAFNLNRRALFRGFDSRRYCK